MEEFGRDLYSWLPRIRLPRVKKDMAGSYRRSRSVTKSRKTCAIAT